MHAFFVYHEDDLTKVTHGPHVHQVILVTAMRNHYLGTYAAFKERKKFQVHTIKTTLQKPSINVVLYHNKFNIQQQDISTNN